MRLLKARPDYSVCRQMQCGPTRLQLALLPPHTRSIRYDQTVQDVKEAVAAKLGVAPDKQQLFWHKKELTVGRLRAGAWRGEGAAQERERQYSGFKATC